jgi:hypothetical protein
MLIFRTSTGPTGNRLLEKRQDRKAYCSTKQSQSQAAAASPANAERTKFAHYNSCTEKIAAVPKTPPSGMHYHES